MTQPGARNDPRAPRWALFTPLGHRVARVLLVLALASAGGLLADPARALTILRCGNSYTDAPSVDAVCDGGLTLEATDPRTPAQAQEQRVVVDRTRAAADKLEAQRHAREADEQQAQARAQQELRHQLEFEARMRRLEPAAPVVTPGRGRIAGVTTGSATPTVPPLNHPPIFRVPRPPKPVASAPRVPASQVSTAEDRGRTQD